MAAKLKVMDESVVAAVDRLVQEIGINNTLSVPLLDDILVASGLVHDERSMDYGSAGRSRRNLERANAKVKINRVAATIDTPFKLECVAIGETYKLEAIEVNAILLAERRLKKLHGNASLGSREVNLYLARDDLHEAARAELERHKRHMRTIANVIEVYRREQETDGHETRQRLEELARQGRMIVTK